MRLPRGVSLATTGSTLASICISKAFLFSRIRAAARASAPRGKAGSLGCSSGATGSGNIKAPRSVTLAKDTDFESEFIESEELGELAMFGGAIDTLLRFD